MMRDDGKEDSRWAIRLCSALLPVSYRRGGEAESRRKPRLAEAEAPPNRRQVDWRWAVYLDAGNTDAWNALASGVCEGLVEAG